MTLDWALSQLSRFGDFKASLDESTSTLEAVEERPNGEEGGTGDCFVTAESILHANTFSERVSRLSFVANFGENHVNHVWARSLGAFDSE